MGLARGAVALLLEEAARRTFEGRIGTLGRQTLYLSSDDLRRQFEKFSVQPKEPIKARIEAGDDEHLFRAMGFEAVESFDYSDFEGATHVVDLNADGLLPELEQRFDVLLDSGTLEHVFHVPNALKNIVSLVKVGGRVIFLSPSSNHLDHGFYMFSPTFFVDFFSANHFQIDTCYMVAYSPNLQKLWEVYEYSGDWRNLHIGGLDAKPYAIFFVATRLANSTGDAIPQQGYYANTASFYAGARLASDGSTTARVTLQLDAGERAEKAHTGAKPKAFVLLRGVLRHVPVVYRLAQWIRGYLRRHRLSKTLVGRY